MRFPDTITEEQRSEIFWAISERHKRLLALEESTVKQHAPADGVRRQLRLYGSGTLLVKGEPVEVVGLISMFAPDPELPLETIQGMERKVDDAPDLFGGGAETGGGVKAGGKGTWKGKRGGPPEKIGLAIDGVVGSLTPEIIAQREAAKEAEAAARKRAGPVWIQKPGETSYTKAESIPDGLPEGTIVLWEDPEVTAISQAANEVIAASAATASDPVANREEQKPEPTAEPAIPDPNDRVEERPKKVPTVPTTPADEEFARAAERAAPKPGAAPLPVDYGTRMPTGGDGSI
jgi:hypothetical protein